MVDFYRLGTIGFVAMVTYGCTALVTSTCKHAAYAVARYVGTLLLQNTVKCFDENCVWVL